MVNNTLKAAVYLRVSTEMQVDGYSLDAQLDSIRRYEKAYDIDTVAVYEDRGKSGKSVEGRPDFIRMMTDIQESKINVDYVLVFKLSRFGRNAADVFSSLEKLQTCGVNLICTEDKLDSSSGSGKLIIAVLAAISELERVNILEQTMSGRQQKAREGLWNGGQVPYGYKKDDDTLAIEETEAVAIRVIFDKYINTDLGYNGIAKYLNRQGIAKIPRKNGRLTQWSAKLIRDILDNEIYVGKITYGKRVKEQVKGTKDTYKQVRKESYITVEGKHPAILSAEDWAKVRAKRELTGVRSPSAIGRDRVHLLSGLLRCPECGSPMHTNRNSWTNKDGTYVEKYYYTCSRNRQERGAKCSYKASLRKDAIEPDVLSAVRELVKNEAFAEDLKAKIGKEIDTAEIDKELAKYNECLRQSKKVVSTLEDDIDVLPHDMVGRELMKAGMDRRLRTAYGEIFRVETAIDDLLKKRQAVENNVITMEQIYQILESFDKLYDRMAKEEQRRLLAYLIENIEIHKEPTGNNLSRLKAITFTFPVSYGGEVSDKVLWDKETHVETIILMTNSGSKTKK